VCGYEEVGCGRVGGGSTVLWGETVSYGRSLEVYGEVSWRTTACFYKSVSCQTCKRDYKKKLKEKQKTRIDTRNSKKQHFPKKNWQKRMSQNKIEAINFSGLDPC